MEDRKRQVKFTQVWSCACRRLRLGEKCTVQTSQVPASMETNVPHLKLYWQ
uniref:Uncharacterized protein n=1 Tax=Anguilla anguilla TaxID=7936 RepID=A0A0E9XLM3_ANGAN